MTSQAPITFVPRRGAILMCDFGLDPSEPWPSDPRPIGFEPEMTKVRRSVVVSPVAFNNRHGNRAGLCVVVPISTKPQKPVVPPFHVPLLRANYRALTADGWAKCNLPCTVSHDRLHVPRIAGRLVTNVFVTWQDLALIEDAMRLALGL